MQMRSVADSVAATCCQYAAIAIPLYRYRFRWQLQLQFQFQWQLQWLAKGTACCYRCSLLASQQFAQFSQAGDRGRKWERQAESERKKQIKLATEIRWQSVKQTFVQLWQVGKLWVPFSLFDLFSRAAFSLLRLLPLSLSSSSSSSSSSLLLGNFVGEEMRVYWQWQ